MPLNIDLIQILMHIFNFLILAGGLTLLLFNPITKFLDERRNQIEKQYNAIKQAKPKNDSSAKASLEPPA